MSCAWPDCEQESSMSAGILRNRKRERLSYYCSRHADNYRDACFAVEFPSPYLLNESGYISFDLFLVFHGGDRSVLWFREIGGERGIGFVTGPAEGYSLQARLGVETPGVLSSHSAWLEVVQRLGGYVNRTES
jgi:hypothetical protein